MTYFKSFRVKPKEEKLWNDEKGYNVLALDIEKREVTVEPEQEESNQKDLAKDEDDEEREDKAREQLMLEDLDTEEHTVMFLLLGNPKTKEIQWFDINDVEFISS